MAGFALIVTMSSAEFTDMLETQSFRLAINVRPPSFPQRRVGPRELLSSAVRTAFVVDAEGGFELLDVRPPRVHFSAPGPASELAAAAGSRTAAAGPADDEPPDAPPSIYAVPVAASAPSTPGRDPPPRLRRSAARGPRPPMPYYWSIPACWVASVVAAFVICLAAIAVLVFLLIQPKN